MGYGKFVGRKRFVGSAMVHTSIGARLELERDIDACIPVRDRLHSPGMEIHSHVF